MRTFIRVRPLLLVAVMFAAGCSSNTTPLTPQRSFTAAAPAHVSPGLTKPALITIDLTTGDLEYWPFSPNGGDQPKQLSQSLGIFQAYGMAANGNVVAISNYSPAEVVTYNVKTKAMKTLADPYGGPVDLAIGKDGTIYALNLKSVTVFPPGSSQPSELSCTTISSSVAVAVDNESDVFVNGYGSNFMGVVEYAAGSKTCSKVPIRQEQGYAGGVGIDPKTDDLIVVDNPDLCAGGIEGEMTVYPKPYSHKFAHRKDLNAQYCGGTFRLDATSKTIFLSDATVSAGYPLIDQYTYPGGVGGATYQDGPLPSGDPFGGFTTIPNRLPN